MSMGYVEKNAKPKSGIFSIDKTAFKKGASLGITAILLFSLLTGCNKPESEDTLEDNVNETQVSGITLTQEEYDLFKNLLEQQDKGNNIGEDDTYSTVDWNKFVGESLNVLTNKLNNTNKVNLELALSVWNINHLDATGKQVLLDLYSTGRDVESILNAEYSLASQLREYNTEIKDINDYYSMSNLTIDKFDVEVIKAIEDLYKEAFELRDNLTSENKARFKVIFDTILAFSNGTGKIGVTIDGKVREVAQIELSDGGIFAAEIAAQQLSVISKDIISQELREELDGHLRSKDNLARVTASVIKYTTIATLDGVNLEEQAKIVKAYEETLEIIKAELAEFGISEEEAQSLLVVYNIDYFVSSLESQNAFKSIYSDGFNLNETFALAEEAVAKMVLHNDSQKTVNDIYDMARLSMNSIEDAISLRAVSQTAYNVTSSDEAVAQNAANTISGYSSFSSDVKVEYQTRDDENNLINHSLDKNALTKGGYMVANWYTYYSLTNHKTIYDKYIPTNDIIKLVDGTSRGLDPYEDIVFMIEDYCAENNIVVYDYEIGNKK